MEPKELVDLFSRVRDGIRPDWEHFRRLSARGNSSLRDWATGKRTPTPYTMGRLAAYLRDYSARLARLAEEVEAAVPAVAEQKRQKVQRRSRAKAGQKDSATLE